MPIYEFKCLKCEECFELLVMNKQENIEMQCPKCDSNNLERILSSTNYSFGGSSGGQQGGSSKTRTCPSGSCTTYEIPGPAG